jgi:hypothetical protein
LEIGGGSLAPSAVSVSSDPRTTRPGDQIEVAIIQTVGLGAFGSVLASIGITATDPVMDVTAQARQE